MDEVTYRACAEGLRWLSTTSREVWPERDGALVVTGCCGAAAGRRAEDARSRRALDAFTYSKSWFRFFLAVRTISIPASSVGGLAICWSRRRSSAFFLIRCEARTAKKAPKKLMGLVERLLCRSIRGGGPSETDAGGRHRDFRVVISACSASIANRSFSRAWAVIFCSHTVGPWSSRRNLDFASATNRRAIVEFGQRRWGPASSSLLRLAFTSCSSSSCMGLTRFFIVNVTRRGAVGGKYTPLGAMGGLACEFC
mmetsp:Transcript_148787/g.259950  ORF Transcript_148787/g.259950 Transcript_148787/m.259950 type:complete len:254 (-) Transcript_148787:285-1046(-)